MSLIIKGLNICSEKVESLTIDFLKAKDGILISLCKFTTEIPNFVGVCARTRRKQ